MAVFISYVREDSRFADHISSVLRENGLDVWLDRDAIQPGVRWKDAIRDAIQKGSYFIALFSNNHAARLRSYANEELTQAIEILRQTPRDRAWLIPIKVDGCDIPPLPIFPGETLRDINWISLADHYEENITRLLRALGVKEPKIGFGEPLAPGYRHFFELVGGEITYEKFNPPIPMMDGMVFHITGGWCARQPEGHIAAQIMVGAPNKNLEKLNSILGFNKFFAITSYNNISLSQENPTNFSMTREFSLPRGLEIPPMLGNPAIVVNTDIPGRTEFEANGHLEEDRFYGKWKGLVEYKFPGKILPIKMSGQFDIRIKE